MPSETEKVTLGERMKYWVVSRIAASTELYEALERLTKAAAIVLLLDMQGITEGREQAMGELNMATFNARAALLKANPEVKDVR